MSTTSQSSLPLPMGNKWLQIMKLLTENMKNIKITVFWNMAPCQIVIINTDLPENRADFHLHGSSFWTT